jgi:hypothetical protein
MEQAERGELEYARSLGFDDAGGEYQDYLESIDSEADKVD